MKTNDVIWNPWHGCRKKSEGCLNCYVYRRDEKYDLDTMKVYKTKAFNLPVRKNKSGEYKIPSGSFVWTCFTSDFLLEDADEWRKDAWEIIFERQDLHFLFITKRIERFMVSMPKGIDHAPNNLTVCCTCENQVRADMRLPSFLEMPIKHRQIICEPLLEPINLSPYLDNRIECVSVGGESGATARECRYEWILSIRDQCIQKGVPFRFHQTGASFVKDGRHYRIDRRFQHTQARRAGIDTLYDEIPSDVYLFQEKEQK